MAFDGDINTYEGAIAPVRETHAQRVIRRARERIAIHQKWVKGRLRHRGRMCLLGALEPGTWVAARFVERAIKLEGHICSIPQFNDLPETRHADILRVLDRAYAFAADKAPPAYGARSGALALKLVLRSLRRSKRARSPLALLVDA